MNPADKNAPPWIYEIAVHGELGERWARWLDGLAQTAVAWDKNSEVTVLTIQLRDQAALRGVLNQLWDLNLTLIGVRRLQSHPRKEVDCYE